MGGSSQQLLGRRVARLLRGPSAKGQQRRARRVPTGAPGLIITKGSAGGRLWGKKPGGVREADSLGSLRGGTGGSRGRVPGLCSSGG